jgi:hypothetical protein
MAAACRDLSEIRLLQGSFLPEKTVKAGLYSTIINKALTIGPTSWRIIIMKRLVFLCLPLLLLACNTYEKENNRLKDEIRLLREENNYLKAEIIGLKKELGDLSTKVEGEKQALRKKAEDERAEMQGKIEETRAAVQKRTEGDKNRTVKKDQAANGKNGSPGKPQTQKEGLP